MKHIFAFVSVYLVVVNCQSNRPPRPPASMGPKGTPVPMPGMMPPPTPTKPAYPSRPKGCSPGCGGTEICAELGKSYCSSGLCSVCIKMSSIRFPASALAGMFSQQTQPKPVQPVQPAVQAQPVAQVMPPSNPFGTSENATIEQLSNSTSTIMSTQNTETEISIVEYAAQQRKLLLSEVNWNATVVPTGTSKPPPPPQITENTNSYKVIQGKPTIQSIALSELNGNATVAPTGTSKPPPPPQITDNTNSYKVIQGKPTIQSIAAGAGISTIQDKQLTSTPFKDTTPIDLGTIDTKQVKYPIIVTVPETSKPLDKANMTQAETNAALLNPTASPTVGRTRTESHYGHIDQTQMAKWYQRYQAFKALQARLNGGTPTAKNQATDAFDFATFKKFQQWLKLNQQETTAQDQSTLVQTATTPVINTPKVIPTIPPTAKPILPVATPTVPSPTSTVQQPTPMFNDHNSLQKQYNSWRLQQQNKPTASFTQQQPVTVSQVPQPAVPVAQVSAKPQNALDFASMQQQFLQMQQQQKQQQQQNQANIGAVQINPIANNPQPQTQTAAQTPAFDYAAFQQQYQQWQQNHANQQQAPTTTAAPPIDYSVLQQQWQQQQQQQQQQNQELIAPVPNNQQTQQPSYQEIQNNNQPNPQTSQQQNTFSYVPQQPVNTYNNDPFAANDPFANNNMMNMMLFDGFGGGLFGF